MTYYNNNWSLTYDKLKAENFDGTEKLTVNCTIREKTTKKVYNIDSFFGEYYNIGTSRNERLMIMTVCGKVLEPNSVTKLK